MNPLVSLALYALLAVALAMLKVSGRAAPPWWLVFAPLWAPVALGVVLGIIGATIELRGREPAWFETGVQRLGGLAQSATYCGLAVVGLALIDYHPIGAISLVAGLAAMCWQALRWWVWRHG